MTKQEQIQRLQEVRTDRSAWEGKPRHARLKVTVGDMVLHVGGVSTARPTWMVEHTRLGVIAGWAYAETANAAIAAACDFAIAHLEGKTEEQHAE